MIRFCDKEVYSIIEGDITRSRLIQFFLQDGMKRVSIVAVYGANENFEGIITYQDLLKYETLDKAINRSVIKITEHFWEEAREFFSCQKDRMLTILDDHGCIQGFAYNDDNIKYKQIEETFSVLENVKLNIPKVFQRVEIVVITDLNEFAWKSYKLFTQIGIKVCVIGEKWKWFGFKSGYGYMEYPDYAKMFVYSEGADIIRAEIEAGNYTDISYYFSFVHEFQKRNKGTIYKKVVEQLSEKGVAICECGLPLTDEIQKMTPDEEKSIKLEVEMDDYIADLDTFTDEKRSCLWRIYGKENAITYKYIGNETQIQKVPLGETYGKMLRGGVKHKYCYLFGCCIVAGYGCLEPNTLQGQLEKLLDRYEYQVIAVDIRKYQADRWAEYIKHLPIREQDIILIINHTGWFPKNVNCMRLELKTVYENKMRKSIFCRHTFHTNTEGNRMLAEEIMNKYILDKINEFSKKRRNDYVQKGELLDKEGKKSVEEYVNRICIGGDDGKSAGAIVMNCNPFTKGHLYLIEYASKRVERLYVFVVEEDKSFFKFEDRFVMVKKGTKDFANVVVVPSGEWVLSYKTMPIYFSKETKQEMKVDAKPDLEIFARYIAPGLGIKKRFVGEEPLDRITSQYNEQIADILPLFDIEVEEVPRMAIEEEVVSASIVRECMKNGKWDKVSRLVPDSTYEICRKYSLQKDRR